MKIRVFCLLGAAIGSSVSGQTTSGSLETGTSNTSEPNAIEQTTTSPTSDSFSTPNGTTLNSTETTQSSMISGNMTMGNSSTDAFVNLETKTYPQDSYHMPPVRVIHARVQSDAPMLVDGVFVSSFGDGDLEAGYLSAMDTVNTASVEGALMYVQAEGINVNVRAEEERCVRKSEMAYIVFYEILIVQTNETIAQFQDTWGETPEYGPMLPMDSGRCSPLSGKDDFPAGCLQFNGDDGQPNVGPFIGGGIKDDDVRAPYPDNYWFSFPGTCPLESWGDKTDKCRSSTRKGLCDYGKGPDGVECTFAYNILGWVTIDDVVGITAIENPETNSTYSNFTEWCLADSNNTEFSGDAQSGEMVTGLPFWEDPLNSTANAARAEAVIATYIKTLSSGSTQIESSVIAAFHALPTPEELASSNPPCYQTVESCGSGNGCKRVGYSQLCTECSANETCSTGGSGFEFPKLSKAFTTLPDDETTTPNLNRKGGTGSGSTTGTSDASASFVFTASSMVFGLIMAMLAL
ncbi:hypothetical protein PHYSODRAFT_539865 [Plasmopara halstedii]|uniref:RxLR-like protein n=1 Tax=Plasmopara halstedii TaxID=4781 RepID=A0A0N7L783_PLAHL|nr:hypothetical protein PHYSODRAFT_539865 [Plasmopara halstedii]CEG46355.1 hypothetical protein PHYSODRAFT_539865 [Plasmopara halstedii]|eukprot:XP_024582724.1 hypothetical protein PHYSODRAFT_539865 [Plasmopara halstedii]